MVKVAQCWDDGVCTDIRVAEILRKYNAKATFNLNPGFHDEKRREACWVGPEYTGWSYKGFSGGKIGLNEMKEIYSGFEVASHCMKHECAGLVPDEEFLKAALDARHFLEDLFQKECHGFAWPCGRFTQSTADAMLEAGFEYGRTCRNVEHVGQYEHPMLLDSSCHFQDNGFYKIFEKAKAENGIFYFWGHSYEMMDSEGMWKQFEDKIRFLCNDPEVEWCNVIDIVRK